MCVGLVARSGMPSHNVSFVYIYSKVYQYKLLGWRYLNAIILRVWFT